LKTGDKFKVKTFLGTGGNVVSQLPDGRMILFGLGHPYNRLVGPDQEVEVRLVKIHPNYIIVDTIGEGVPLESTETPETEYRPIIEELEKVSKEGYGDTAVIARALLHVIRLQSLLIKMTDENKDRRR